MFQLVDSLNKIHLRPETKNKLKKIREDIDKTIKEEAEKEKKEEVCLFLLLFLRGWYLLFVFMHYLGSGCQSRSQAQGRGRTHRQT
jgi:hypothetical protein